MLKTKTELFSLEEAAEYVAERLNKSIKCA
jgi:hypothetical protein